MFALTLVFSLPHNVRAASSITLSTFDVSSLISVLGQLNNYLASTHLVPTAPPNYTVFSLPQNGDFRSYVQQESNAGQQASSRSLTALQNGGTLTNSILVNPAITGGTISGATFSGAGTGLTGTAASLSIGGSAPAGSLTGATLAAGVTASSLTSVGTLSSGAVPASLVTAGTFGTGNYSFGTGPLTVGAITSSGALALGSNTINSGLINGQTISSAANFTGSLTMNGAFANTSASNSYFTGNVGIGTTAPQYLLDVNGTINTNDIITKGPTIDVRAFGAKGNGTTDDTVAFDAALNAANTAGGGTVNVPCGNYKVSHTFYLYSNTRLLGSGKCSNIQALTAEKSNLTADGSGTSITVADGTRFQTGWTIAVVDSTSIGVTNSPYSAVANITNISGNVLTLSRTLQTSGGVPRTYTTANSAQAVHVFVLLRTASNTANVEVGDLSFTGANSMDSTYYTWQAPLVGMTQSPSNVYVHDLWLQNSTSDAITTEAINGLRAERINSTYNTGNGFHLGAATHDGWIKGGFFQHNGSVSGGGAGTSGIYFCDNNYRITISGNDIGYNASDGIVGVDASGGVRTDQDLMFENNTVHDNNGHGFSLWNTSHISITGNTIENNGQSADWKAGIYISGSTYVTASGNIIRDTQVSKTQAYAIQEANGADYNSLVGNTTDANKYSPTVVLVGSHTVLIDQLAGEIMPGKVGIGTTNPGQVLTVAGSVGFPGIGTGAGTAYLCTTLATGVVSTSTSACAPSSIRYKNNVQTLSDARGLDLVMQMRPVTYTYKPELLISGNQVGFIAEEMAPLVPEVVGLDASGTPANIDYAKLTPIIVKAIQTLNQKVDHLTGTSTQTITDSSGFLSDLSYVGGTIINGVLHFAQLAIDHLIAHTVTTDNLELKDVDTGQPYCLEIKSGVFSQVQGSCTGASGTQTSSSSSTNMNASSTDSQASSTADINTGNASSTSSTGN